MSELLLVTGFLGAGKTTLMLRLIEHFGKKRLSVIVNEFGRVSVDGARLSALGVSLREIDNGSIFCACRLDQFEKALAQALAQTPDMILVETSGLSDPTSIRDVLARFPDIDYLGCIALADVKHVRKVLETARPAARQLAVANVVLLNKIDLVSPETLREVGDLLRARFPRARVFETVRANFPEAALDFSNDAPQAPQPFDRAPDLTLQRACVRFKETIQSTQIRAFCALFSKDAYRVKGILRLADGVFFVDCTGDLIEISPYSGAPRENALVLLAGRGQSLRKTLHLAKTQYSDYILEVNYT